MWHHLPWESISGLLAEAGGRYRAHGRSPLTPWVSPRDTICPTPIMTRHAFFLRWKKNTIFLAVFSSGQPGENSTYLSVSCLFPSLALLSIWDDRKALKKHRFVWNFVQNETAFCNLGSDLSWWSVRRWTWCVSPTILDPATCQRPILGKWRRYRGRSKFSDHLRRRFMRREKWSGL